MHVFLLPAALIGFVVAHLYLMRRHGISGPIGAVSGEQKPFYPYHALKDTIATAFVFAVLLTLAIAVEAPLDEMADPSDATYIPRPEWYFLSLFQLLKYFPGPLDRSRRLSFPAFCSRYWFFCPSWTGGESGIRSGGLSSPARSPSSVLAWRSSHGLACKTHPCAPTRRIGGR